jgi:plastocyanin
VVLLALSTGHKIGLGLSGTAFIIFALTSAVVIPRLRPDFPGRRLGVFVLVAVLFFIGMIAAVAVFGAEKKKAGHAAPPAAPAATSPASKTVQVSEKEFAIAVSATSLSAGTITFDVKNVGHIQHDLVIAGTTYRTKLISPGQTAMLTAQLKPGTYELYCSVTGHKQLGMDVKVPVR